MLTSWAPIRYLSQNASVLHWDLLLCALSGMMPLLLDVAALAAVVNAVAIAVIFSICWFCKLGGCNVSKGGRCLWGAGPRGFVGVSDK